MSSIDTKYDSFIFMKVGNHAGETWEQILERKNKEYERTGSIFWGYGGMACHPIKQVQPFALSQKKKNGSVHLLMNFVKSNFGVDTLRAKDYSIDGINWIPIPDGIDVTGSRYALILEEIKPGDFDLNLDEFKVGIGQSRDKVATEYLQGRTDKACLIKSDEIIPNDVEKELRKRRIDFTAELKDPFAAMLRY